MSESPWPVLSFGDPAQPLLVMLHGFLGQGSDWAEVASVLARTHFVICPDLPGHGKATLTRAVPFEYAAEGLNALLLELGLAQCDLVGYSMGGRLALHFATVYPERVNRLVLESASPGIEDAATRASRCQHDDTLANELAGLEDAAQWTAWLRQWYSEPLWTSLHAVRGRIEELIAARAGADTLSLSHALRSFSSGRQPNLWPALSRLACPVFVITGELDHKYTKISERMVDQNERIARMIFSGCGHNVHVESASAYTTAINRFLCE